MTASSRSELGALDAWRAPGAVAQRLKAERIWL